MFLCHGATEVKICVHKLKINQNLSFTLKIFQKCSKVEDAKNACSCAISVVAILVNGL